VQCLLRQFARRRIPDEHRHDEGAGRCCGWFGRAKYDHCTRTTAELADSGSEVTSGEFTGIGTRGYWQFEADNFGGVVDAEYGVCVWDGGVAVQVQIELSREKDSPAVGRDELDSVARAQARKVLDGLRQN
jgi:hypothetical protein